MTDLRDKIAAALLNADNGGIVAYLEMDEPELLDTDRVIDGTINFAKLADAVIAALGGMEVLQYLEVPQRVLLSTPDWREAINENRPDYILAIRAQALDKVQELIEPYENDASPHPEAWARIVEAAFPPPPMAGRSSE